MIKTDDTNQPIVEPSCIDYCGNQDITTIKSTVKGINWNFSEVSTNYLTHDIHPYPAKFIPQVPSLLMQLLSKKGDLIWDPFAGSGTTALEAIRMDRRSINTDINPVSEIIGRVKTTTLNYQQEKTITRLIKTIEHFTTNFGSYEQWYNDNNTAIINEVPQIPHIEKWFTESAIKELASIK